MFYPSLRKWSPSRKGSRSIAEGQDHCVLPKSLTKIPFMNSCSKRAARLASFEMMTTTVQIKKVSLEPKQLLVLDEE